MMMLGLYTAPPSQGGQLLLDCTPFVQNASCTTDARGFEGLSATLTRPLLDAFRLYDAPLLAVGLFEGGQIVWEGRLEDPTLSAGGQGSGLSVGALGSWRALSDDTYNAFWSKTTLDGFVPITTAQTVTRSPEKWELNTNGDQIYLAMKKNENFGAGTDIGSLTWIVPHLSSVAISGASFDFEYKAPAGWTARFDSLDRVFLNIAGRWSLNGNGAVQTGSVHVTYPAFERVAFLIKNDTGGNVLKATDTGVDYLRITNLRLVGATTNRVNTTLTVARTNGSPVTCTVGSTAGMYVGQRLVINSAGANSESVVIISIPSSTTFTANVVNAPGGGYPIGTAVQAHQVYADEIVRAVVSQVATLNSSQLSSSTALIRSPGIDLTDASYEDASPIDVIANLAARGDNAAASWECGVYEGRALFFRPQGSTARAWYVDASDLNVARSLEQLANRIYAVYNDANGVSLRTAATTDATSVARYGLTRRAALPIETTIAAVAGFGVSTGLADQKDPTPRAGVRFTAVYDAAGARYPLSLVRSGDTITIRNLPPNLSTSVDRIRTFRISHTTYDIVADTLQVEPEAPQPTLEAMLARGA